MARGKERNDPASPAAISIIGPGMQVAGDCTTEGTIRIEGRVVGSVWAGKAVVIGKNGVLHGDLHTQDAVIAGEVVGTLLVASRLEIQGSARIEGEIQARRVQLEEGALLNGDVRMGEVVLDPPPESGPSQSAEERGGRATSRRTPSRTEGRSEPSPALF
ncbi:MAG: polymer-forming cytoskeletal protein [Gemmatimonadota bacterium]